MESVGPRWPPPTGSESCFSLLHSCTVWPALGVEFRLSQTVETAYIPSPRGTHSARQDDSPKSEAEVMHSLCIRHGSLLTAPPRSRALFSSIVHMRKRRPREAKQPAHSHSAKLDPVLAGRLGVCAPALSTAQGSHVQQQHLRIKPPAADTACTF